jgi:hypothetical protein
MNYSICAYYKFTATNFYINTSVSKTTTHKLRILDKFQKSCDYFQPLNFLKLILRTKKKRKLRTQIKRVYSIYFLGNSV